MSDTKTLRKDVVLPAPPERVWAALTDPRALAEWLMPNDFEPVEGRAFQFRVDPMLGFEGVSECRVLELDPPRRMVWSWVSRMKGKPPHPPMTLVWSLEPAADGGTRLTLTQTGLEALNLWWRFSMKTGWGRMLEKLLPKVVARVDADGSFTPGAVRRRDYGTKTVPGHFAR